MLLWADRNSACPPSGRHSVSQKTVGQARESSMAWIKRYPVVSIALVLVACVRYEYHAESFSLVVPGLAGGIVVLGIVSIVLFYRIFNAVEKLLRTKGWLKQPLKHRYDVLRRHVVVGEVTMLVQLLA